jgi:CHAT domain-containing protein/tetratricopeptide (TPR) repeat protein
MKQVFWIAGAALAAVLVWLTLSCISPKSGTRQAADIAVIAGMHEEENDFSLRQGYQAAVTPARYALVIGNANYANIMPLDNPINDAEDIASALRKLGFEVDLRKDLDRMETVDAIRGYINKLTANPESEGFFWYAGHGMQIADENYLLPCDVKIDNEEYVEMTSYKLSKLLDRFHEAGNKINIAVIDACRDNPLQDKSRGGGRNGLAAVRISAQDLYVIFSTAPGAVAQDGAVRLTGNGEVARDRNSPFAKAFLLHAETAEPVALMVIDVTNDTRTFTRGKQSPYISGSISDKYYSLRRDDKANLSFTDDGPANPVYVPVTGSIVVTSDSAGIIVIDGQETGQTIKEQGTITISNVPVGLTSVRVRAGDGELIDAEDDVLVRPGETASIQIDRSVTHKKRGDEYYEAGNFRQAVQEYTRAAELRPDNADYLFYAGAAYLSMGDYAAAEKYYRQTVDVFEKTVGKEHPYYARLLINLGVLYRDLGDFARAESCLLEAKDIFEKTLGKDHPDYAVSLNYLGALWYATGDYARAETYILEAKTILGFIMGKDHPDYAASVNNLGLLYYAMGDYGRAEGCLLEAKAIYEKTLSKESAEYAVTLNSLGGLYCAMDDYAKAESLLLEAKDIQEKTLGKEHPGYAATVRSLSLLYQDIGAYTKAVDLEEMVSRLQMDTVNRVFSFLSAEQRGFYWNSISSDFESGYSLSYFSPGTAANGMNYNNTLFSRGLLLSTANTMRDRIFNSGDAALIGRYEELGRLRRQISALRQSGGNQEYIQNLEAILDTLDRSLVRDSAVFRELMADMEMRWQDVQAALKEGEAAIEFVSFRLYDKGWTDKTMYAALVLRPGMEAPAWIPLCDSVELERLFTRAEDRVKDTRTAPQDLVRILYDIYGAELYNAVWRPLEKELEGVTTVYYSPSGLLHRVAFNAVPVSEDNSIRLADTYGLNMVSSTRELAHWDRSGSLSINSAVIYGGLQYRGGVDILRQAAQKYKPPADSGVRRDFWNFLPGTMTEALAIKRQLDEKKIPSTIYTGIEGNEESFKNLDGKKTGLIHLATSAFFLEDIERNSDERALVLRLGGGTPKAAENPLLRSGLILAGGNFAWSGSPIEGIEDGILTADEVAGLNLTGTKLAVLSACQTGLGELHNSEGVFGLQRAFKLAGVESLITSLWEVDDRATSLLMIEFYRRWLNGEGKLEAFKGAQGAVREAYPEPYYWAAFLMMD